MNKKWEEVKLKHLYNLTNGGTPKSDEPTYWEPKEIEWITPEDLSTSGKKVNTVKRKISKRGLANSSATLIKENSVVISTRAPIGNPKLVPFQYSTNQGCKSMSPRQKNNSSPEYLYYFLSANEEKLKNLGRGTTFLELSNFALRNFKILNPSIKEQNYIAKFLDVKTSEIDTLIEDKEKLIALLEEKRQALITEAVTKGLDPDVQMKDSGVEWIGEIPEHWRIIKLKHLFNIRTGGTPKSNDLEYWDANGIIWITPGDLSSPGDTISDSNKKISEAGLINSSANYISENSIVISTRAPIGNMKIVTMNYTTNQGCKSLESKNENHNIIYYFNLLRYRKNVLESLGQGTTFLELSSNNLKEFEVPVMKKKEQDRIVEVIQNLNNINDKLLVEIKNQITKLKEYRQALIYEAVTGKIDVQKMLKETELEEVSSS